ncbi:mastermind-like domain-containing protein 1 isoform X1 [Temnothorax curvispinosus]|uniref:Mastermind-like domain-containing protein 1 isoform X1 n=1 Tax=Temnothorax curvispinosus TaxID=300111 RepID=A0A6J1QHL6_9HYME|nr:mastermind-like domain-containing protein 1 isoform X1 [Temnothorax curvispinosus]
MTDHVVESTFELSAFMKAGVMAGSERDSGSCSSVDEDSRSSLHSPTSSEDSVEVQVTPISLRNKRKLAEPRKIQEPAVIATPLKKRRFDPISSSEIVSSTTVDQEEARSLNTPNPFRPWIPASYKNESKTTVTSTTTSTSTISNTTTTTTTTTTALSSERKEEERRRDQDETTQRLHESFRRLQHSPGHNRSAVSSRREPRQRLFESLATPIAATTPPSESVISLPHPRLQDEPLSLVVRNEAPRVPSHPAVSGSYEKTPSYMMEHLLATSSGRNHQNHQAHQSQRSHQSHQAASASRHHHQGGQQRNYKNMTRERRIEANARERTRVHTISAAFDTLRRAIPAYSHNQKLSKLSVLRIACSYIMTLVNSLGKDGEVMATKSNGLQSLSSCVELVSRTIQTEGKLRKRKDD